MFPEVLKDEVSLTESSTRHHLNSIRAAGVCFYDRKQFFIGRLPDIQPFHQGRRRLKSNSESRTRVAVKLNTGRKIAAQENLFITHFTPLFSLLNLSYHPLLIEGDFFLLRLRSFSSNN
jgi:hypothetical protein